MSESPEVTNGAGEGPAAQLRRGDQLTHSGTRS